MLERGVNHSKVGVAPHTAAHRRIGMQRVVGLAWPRELCTIYGALTVAFSEVTTHDEGLLHQLGRRVARILHLIRRVALATAIL